MTTKEGVDVEKTCSCRYTDVWKCAVDLSLPSMTCRCSCHDRRKSPKRHPKELSGCQTKVKELEKELAEQCRLNGMGQERELRLMTENRILREALEMGIANQSSLYAECLYRRQLDRQMGFYSDALMQADLKLAEDFIQQQKLALARARGERE